MSRFIDDEACLSGSGSEDEEDDEYDTNDGFVVSDSEEIVQCRGKKVKLDASEYLLDEDDYCMMEEVLGPRFVDKVVQKKRRAVQVEDDEDSVLVDIPAEEPKTPPKKSRRVVESDDDEAVPVETPTAIPKETPKTIPKAIPKAIPKETPKTIPKETPKTIPRETPKAIPKAIPKVNATPKPFEQDPPKGTKGRYAYPQLPSDNKFIPLSAPEKKSAGKEQWGFMMSK